MHIFYIKNTNSTQVTLSEVESKHAIRVLRLKVGIFVNLIDGVGGFYTAKLLNEHPKFCELEIIDKQENYNKKDCYLQIAIAPTKNIDRFEWFLEKTSEIGIDEITPILSEHSERKVIKSERLNRVILSAVKQSIKAFYPRLSEIQKFKDFVNIDFDGEKYIAHCNSWDLPLLKKEISLKGKFLILIGPEGDFSPEEVELALSKGFKEISLGTSRLRTETAGIVACHTVSLLNLQ